jgi:hypothetical protein
MNNNFGGATFSLGHLFRDEKRKILLEMTDRNLSIAAKNFSDVYYDNYQLMSTMRDSGLPLPDAYMAAVRFTLHRRLMEFLTEEGPLDQPRLARIVADYQHWKHEWEEQADLEKAAESFVRDLVENAFSDSELWGPTLELVRSLKVLNLDPNYYRTQNAFLEGWTDEYAASVQESHLELGLAFARELGLELGFAHRDAPEAMLDSVS